MIESSVLILFTAIYLAILFYLAYRGDKKPKAYLSRFQPAIYTLSLTVYCTSWTFYGAVGNAAQSGLSYFTIYLGPILIYIFFFPFLKRIIALSKRHKTTSIADFIATRYGKSTRLSALVTFIAFVGTMPYIALQIKAIASSYDILTGTVSATKGTIFSDTAFALTIILAIFSILFGARTIDASQHHRGLIHAISFESIIKLISFCAIAFFAYGIVEAVALQNPSMGSTHSLLIQPFESFSFSTDLMTKTLLAAGAIFLLPRQFHVFAVEARGGEKLSRWGLPLYLIIFSIAVIPITAAGLLLMEGNDNADLFVLLLPLFEQHKFLSVLGYLGGFSAATGMVIVATIALSTMVSNDLIFPLLVRWNKNNTTQDFHTILLAVRRSTIFILVLLAYGYYYVGGAEKSLHSVGLVSFAAAIQFLPSVIGAVYWSKGHRNGAFLGLLLGFIIWVYCLLLPSLSHSAWMPQAFVNLMLDSEAFLHPNHLFGIHFDDALTHGVFWSLFFNVGAFIYFSLKASPNLVDRMQAASYIEENVTLMNVPKPYKFKTIDLFELCIRITGEARTKEYFLEHGYGENIINENEAGVEFQKLAEHLLAGSIGSATAEHLISSVATPEQVKNQNLYGFIEQTGQAIGFNRELLQVTLDHIGQAVSVVDANLRVTVWNQKYIDFFKFEHGFMKTGKLIEDVIRYNVGRGYGPEIKEDLEHRIQSRLNFLRHGQQYTFVRTWQDGRVIQTEGGRLPDGGYITTYTDITPLKKAEKHLEAINETLEEKVSERTEMLSSLNQQLEDVINSKTHFLAAASHDLIQPLNASKLYLSALLEDLYDDKDKQDLAKNALNALTTADSLLKSLLHLSKLDSGTLKPEISYLNINDIFQSIENEFSVLAKQQKIELKVISAAHKVTESDKALLLSILQNLVSNALRYTSKGSVVVLCRRASASLLRIEVRDSGAGIPSAKQEEIFHPFKQLKNKNINGVGLGLAICRQASNLLGHMVTVKSQLGEGSTFSITLPWVDSKLAQSTQKNVSLDHRPYKKQWLEQIKIICVDDDQEVLKASKNLLERWGANVSCVNSALELKSILRSNNEFEVVLMDYQLGSDENGLDLLLYCRNKMNTHFLGIIVTAEQNIALVEKTRNLEFQYLAKPIEPAKLRSLLHINILD